MIFYLCNKKKCGDKCSYPECKYTSDYAYALNKGLTPNLNGIFYQEGPHVFEKTSRIAVNIITLNKKENTDE